MRGAASDVQGLFVGAGVLGLGAASLWTTVLRRARPPLAPATPTPCHFAFGLRVYAGRREELRACRFQNSEACFWIHPKYPHHWAKKGDYFLLYNRDVPRFHAKKYNMVSTAVRSVLHPSRGWLG